jgi:tetratricopeptide (TPR) repeat protein
MIAPRDETEKIFQQGEKQYYDAKYLDAITTLRRFNERSNNEELKLKANALIASAEKKYREQENAQARRTRSRDLYNYGMSSLRDNRFRDAIDAFEKSFVADPTYLQANQMRLEANKQLAAVLRRILNEGIALRDQKDYDGAVAAFDRVIQTDKEHELSIEAERLKRATLEERRGAADRHLAIAKDALRLQQYQAALTNFNVVLTIQPQNRDAIEGRREALKQFQSQIDGILQQGRNELDKKNYLQSIVFFDRVLIIDRNNRAAIEGKKQAQEIMERATTIRSVQENMTNAKLRLENRDYELALETLNNIIKAQPNNIEAIELRKKCVAEIEKEKERRKIMTVFSEGARAFRRRNYDIAILKWNEVLKLQKNSSDFDSRVIQEYIQRANILKQEAGNIALSEGDAFFTAKQYKKAKERYAEALQRSPNNADIQLKLTRVNQLISQEVRNSFREGENSFSEGKYDDAIKSYKKILDYEDEGTEIANNAKDELQRAEDALEARKKGDALLEKRNFSEAISQYEYLIAINKKDKYAEEKRREAIVALSREAQRIKQEGISFLNQRNYARAITLLGIVVRVDPDDNEAKSKLAQAQQEARASLEQNYDRGIRAYNAQNWQSSIDAFNIVRSIDPNYKETNKFYRRALENQNRITSQADGQRQGQLQALFYQGISLYRQNKLREAIEVWNRILAVDPSNAQARQYIQRARFRLGG